MTTKAQRSRGIPRRTATIETRRPPTMLYVIGGVIALFVVAAIAAVLVSNGGGGSVSEPSTTNIAVSGQALAPYQSSTADAAVGQVIPTVTGTGLDGEPVTIGPDEGPMAIVILAHWCPHCQAEVPKLVDYLSTTGMPDGVKIVGLSTSINAARPNYPPSAWLDREGWTVPTLVDDSSDRALSALGVTSFPGFVFVDDSGRVVQRMTGEIPMSTFGQAVSALAP